MRTIKYNHSTKSYNNSFRLNIVEDNKASSKAIYETISLSNLANREFYFNKVLLSKSIIY